MKIQFTIICILLAACTSATQTLSSSDGSNASNTIVPNNAALSLADYLKRIPGVQVMMHGGASGGTAVLIRGNNTLGDQREPLFVVDGVNVGFGYENAEPLVAITDIESVRVLKSGQETATYGMQGTNGVIVIKTKRGKK